MVERISINTLERLMIGNVGENATCIVKFYSNKCHLCHALKDTYELIAEEYKDNESVYFFAFNTDDVMNIAEYVDVNGTPSFCAIDTSGKNKISVLKDPPAPHPDTWFTARQIRRFIERTRK